MKEMEQIKNESKKKLIQQGYTEEEAKKTTEQYKNISGYYNDKPSKVRLYNGIELYL